MKLFLTTLFLISILFVSAQDDATQPLENSYISQHHDKAKRKLLRDLSLTDTASGMLISNTGDTSKVIIYLEGWNVTPRMQAYVVAEDSSGKLSFYNPTNIREYWVLMPESGMHQFISVANTLGISCVIRPSIGMTLRQGGSPEESLVGTRIFLQCLIKGRCTLFKYNTGTGKEMISGGLYTAPGGTAVRGAPMTAMEMTATRYCIRKDEGRLIEINAQTIEDAFSECADVKDLAIPAAIREQSKMRELVRAYNKWRTTTDANQRY